LIFIYKINYLNNKVMACGCKNKNNGQTPPPSQQPPAQSNNNQSVQESIRKVVEKYYGKK
jgi:hypothetical protein